jgi:hypothetical protein
MGHSEIPCGKANKHTEIYQETPKGPIAISRDQPKQPRPEMFQMLSLLLQYHSLEHLGAISIVVSVFIEALSTYHYSKLAIRSYCFAKLSDLLFSVYRAEVVPSGLAFLTHHVHSSPVNEGKIDIMPVHIGQRDST